MTGVRLISVSATAWIAGVACAAALALGALAPAAPAATIAYPDLQVQVPAGEISIGHPTATTKSLQFSHITWNAGTGPFEIRPDYNSQTGISQGFQALYTMTSPGVWAFDHTVPIVAPMLYNATAYDYRFPLTAFWLYSATVGGGVGNLVATSPKNEFCIEEDAYVGGVANTPATATYLPATCESPTGVLGLSVGWGDKYDATDAGENIDITGLPDGKYWLRAEADPYHYLAESNRSNDITDTEIQISGDLVTVLAVTHPDSTPPAVALTNPGAGPVAGSVGLAASASGAAPIRSVQFLLDGQPLGAPVTAPPYTYTWTVGSTAPGTHYLSAQATDANGVVGTAPAVAVNVPFARAGSVSIDQDVNQAGRGTIRTPSFSTSAADRLLLAFVSSDGSSATVSGAGLSWTLVKRANTQTGDSEIWAASAPAALGGVAVSSTPASGSSPQQLTVVALSGATGVGASAAAGALSGPQSVSYAATAPGSVGFAVGNDWDNAIARTLGPEQALLSQYLSVFTGDTHWSQYTAVASSAAGQAVKLSDTAPTADRWNLAAVEVLPAAEPPPPPPPPSDTQPPTVAIANPASGQLISGTIPVTASASDNVAVASVQFYLDGLPLGAPVTAGPYASSWDTTTVANGAHTLTARATDTSGNVGESAAVSVTVENPPPPMRCLVMDAKVSADGRGSLTTPTFHTAQPGELLLAFAAADGPSGAGKQSITVSGSGLAWKLVKRANAQSGDAEIWSASAPSTLSGATATATESAGGYYQSLTVISLEESAGTGATVAASATGGAPSVSLKTTQAGSLLYGVGNDWDNATARTLGANQVMLHQYLSTASGDTFWAQNTTVQAGPIGSTATLSDTAPTSDRWNLAAVEVLLGS